LQIVVAPDPRLLKKAELVGIEELPKMKALATEMAELMYETMGCGLAATQVGILKRLIVVDPDWGILDEESGEPSPPDPHFLINPVILRLWGTKELMDEGCLSVPGITVPIERYESIEVEAFDLDGNMQVFEADGFAARVLQHEIDHLEGMTLFERLDPLLRIEAIQLYEDALAAGAKPGDTTAPGQESTRKRVPEQAATPIEEAVSTVSSAVAPPVTVP
jgi:peptide deformylase